MNDKETTIPELINLLKTVEPTLKKEGKTVMLVDSSSFKKDSKNKTKRKATKAKGGVAKKKAKQTFSKGIGFHYGKDGHWKRNRKTYLESMEKKTSDVVSPSGIFVIEINSVSQNHQWVLDTSCGSLI